MAADVRGSGLGAHKAVVVVGERPRRGANKGQTEERKEEGGEGERVEPIAKGRPRARRDARRTERDLRWGWMQERKKVGSREIGG